ncbi:MAG: cyclic nucleotide-binding domain-containing protein [Candidatus Nanopelagicales bacterium]
MARDVRLGRVLAAYAGLEVTDSMTAVTVTLYAFSNGGATFAGLALGFAYLPAAIVAPFIGDVAAGLSRGTRLAVSYAATAVLLSVVTLLVLVQGPLIAVVVAAAVVNIAHSASRPTHYAALPQLASTPGALVRANSTTSFVNGVGNFVGPAVAGVLAAAGFAWLAPGLGVVVLLVASLLCTRLRLAPAVPEDDDEVEGVIAGLRSVGRDHAVMLLVLLSSLAYLAGSAIEILSVSFAANALDLGEASQGLLVGAPAIGTILGALAGAGLAFRRRLAPPFVIGVMGSGLIAAAVSLAPTLGVAAVLLVVVGFSGTIGSLSAETLVQRAVLDSALLRVMALWESLSIVGYTLGAFVAPVLVAMLGPRFAFVPLGVGMALASLLVVRRLRPLDDRAVFRTDVLARLRGVSFLSGLPPAGLDRVSRSAAWVDVDAGEHVVIQGETGDAYYVVDSGGCDVVVDGSLTRELGPGDGFGEIALLLDVPRTATVTARTEGRLLRVDRADFLAALSRSPEGRRSADTIARDRIEHDSDGVS